MWMKMKLFDNININASTAGTAAPQRRRVVFHPFLENCVRFAVSASFSAICQVKHVKYQKQVLINGGMLPAKREEGGREKKKCRCFSAATTCTLGARFFSRITPKNYSGWGIVVHLRAV